MAGLVLTAWNGQPASARVDLPVAVQSTETASADQVVHRATGALDITWHAATQRPDVVFRLYRRADSVDFQLLYELPAIPGHADYGVGDAALAGIQTYELRVAARGDEDGEEVTLGTIEVRIPGWQNKETAPSPRSTSPIGASAAARFPGPSFAPLPVAYPFVAASFTPEPPEPPPRLG